MTDHRGFWTRPNPLKISDGRKYEPDFYLKDYDVYLDPKSLWSLTDENERSKKIVENQKKQLEKIEICKKELNVKIVILLSSDKRSHSWPGILEQIASVG